LYPLPPTPASEQVLEVNKVSVERWHNRLGHPSIPIVQKVVSSHKPPYSFNSNKVVVCDSCQKEKSHKLPYPTSMRTSSHPLELIFFDVWGGQRQNLLGGTDIM
jgi:hypothetical protein